MSASDFLTHSEDVLTCIFDQMEAHAESFDDLDLHDGVLSFAPNPSMQFVLNRHFITQQLWYSSPLSGPSYYTSTDGWRSTATGKNVFQVLEEELATILPQKICLQGCQG